MVWEYGKNSVFSHHASVFKIDKNPVAAVPFAQSVTLSVLSVLISSSTQRFSATVDVSTSWFAVCALHSDSPLLTTECLQVTPSVGSSSSWDAAVYFTATSPATILSQPKLDLRERATANNLKHELEQKQGEEATAELLPNESHDTAKVSLFSSFASYQLQL